jgi:LacI family transcriptional regulator
MPRIPSHKDIAEKADVSQMTVSLALRNHPSLPAATRLRIQRIAQDIGYTRDPRVAEIMGYLRHRRGFKDYPVIAFINVWGKRSAARDNPYFRLFCAGASARAHELGFRLEEFWLREPGMHAARLSGILRTRGILGLILPMIPPGEPSIGLDWEAFSVVAISLNAHALGLHHVCNNRVHTMELTFEQLLRRDYRRIGLVLDRDIDERSRHQWASHFHWAQSRLPLTQRVPLLVQPHYERATFLSWWRAKRPDVVVSPHAPILEWMRAARCQVPAQCGFCGFGLHDGHGSDVAGIDERPALVGSAAIDQVTSQMQRNERGFPQDRREILVEGIWRAGGTLREPPPGTFA